MQSTQTQRCRPWNSAVLMLALFSFPALCVGQSGVSAVTVTPNPAMATVGQTLQFSAAVSGSDVTNSGVTWTVVASSGGDAGTINTTGLYTTPYPAPATVTVTATSVQDTTISGSATVTLSVPAATTGPALNVDVGNETHAINPYIYGMNANILDSTSVTIAQPSIVRWGGDYTSRYNYKLNTSNKSADGYFENLTGAGDMWGTNNTGNYGAFISTASAAGVQTLMTMPVLGWVANSTVTACSFPESQFPGQESYNGTCGDGIDAEGTNGCTSSSGCGLYGNDTIAATTSISNPPPTAPATSDVNQTWAQGTWAGGWVNSILSNYGAANSGSGVAVWDLDNEPAWWNSNHRDVHPNPSTYDEVTNGGIGTALAIKTADPTAQVSGPVIDYWWNYFYSKKDIQSGEATAPCDAPWSNPVDREAHGGVPMIEYYLQQMAAAEQTYGVRLLDYVDVHAYVAATYHYSSVGSTTVAGDTGEQQARMDSTRALWDPTYTDGNNWAKYEQPNYITDPNYTSSCTPPLQALEIIRMMQGWVSRDYPGTKTAITEYNFGGLGSINGAVTQADVLGIFGREGLDMATIWSTVVYNTEPPLNYAFAMYRNYDGNKSKFGDMALASTSASQSQLTVYGALRTADNTVTIMVINKTYGTLNATLSVNNLGASTTSADAYMYSNANLSAIVAQPNVTVTPPVTGSTTSTLSTSFPGQSITLLVMPKD